jgi:hypothetical protein
LIAALVRTTSRRDGPSAVTAVAARGRLEWFLRGFTNITINSQPSHGDPGCTITKETST